MNLHTGELTCPEHGGSYLRSAMAAHPRAKQHWTPLGDWVLMTTADHAEFAGAGLVPKCQTCGAIRAA